MAQARTPKIVAFRVVFAFIETLLIIHTLPMFAQAPSFQHAVAYGSGGYAPISAALGDLNEDGILDIVVANQCVTSDSCPSGGGYICTSADYCSHGAVGVLLGNGDGTFRPAVTYETGGYLSFSVALGDLNGDGKLDLVVVNDCGAVPIDFEGNCPYATLDVMFGNGDGTFSPPEIAKRIFEMGSAIGYSTIWLARAAGPKGKVFYTDGDPEKVHRAQMYFRMAGVAKRIEVQIGDALAIVKKTPGMFDVIFIDVDKNQYPAALHAVRPKLRRGGLLITDNTIWSGKAARPAPEEDKDTKGVQEFNRMVYASKELYPVLIPLRDGLTICRKS